MSPKPMNRDDVVPPKESEDFPVSMFTFRHPDQKSPIYQKAIAILIWLAFAAAGVAALYALSKLAGD